ncbi:MAG: 3'-5' exonuclease [Okeania sp. SIO2H7]|nr:3'-5' exonuclease [Okeania sp. SIO2H7]
MKEYSYWGGDNPPPKHLKTKKQLQEIGLRPVSAVGFIETRKYTCYLYDPTTLKSAKPKRKVSEKQLKILAQNREKQKAQRDYQRWYSEVGFIEEDRVAGVEWAKKRLDSQDFIIFDTETTGLDDPEIVEIAAIAPDGKVLLNTLVKPQSKIEEGAIAVHGITEEMVAIAPSWDKVFPDFQILGKGKMLLSYNLDFDFEAVTTSCTKVWEKIPEVSRDNPRVKLYYSGKDCLMEWYSQWVGEWHYYYENYTWQPLCGGHRALEDCRAALRLIRLMAADSPVSLVRCQF